MDKIDPELLNVIVQTIVTVGTIIGSALGGIYIGKRRVVQGEAQDSVIVKEAEKTVDILDYQARLIENKDKKIESLFDKASNAIALSVKVEMLESKLVTLENEHNLELARINQLHIDRITEFRRELEILRVLVIEKEDIIRQKDSEIIQLQKKIVLLETGAC